MSIAGTCTPNHVITQLPIFILIEIPAVWEIEADGGQTAEWHSQNSFIFL